MTTTRPLDLLMIEDSAADAELTADALRTAGLSAECRRVTDAAGMNAALDQRLPDAILSDWTLPAFSGSAAFEIARQRCPGVPFLFVSGTLRQRNVIDVLRQGATDFIQKHQLELLPLALTRALEERQRRAELLRHAQLIEAQLRLARLDDDLPEDEFLTACLDLAEALTSSQGACLHLVQGETLESAAWSTRGCGAGHPVPPAGALEACLRDKQAQIINDCPPAAEACRFLAVPILNGQVQAILCVGGKPSGYEGRDVEALQLLGHDLWLIVRRRRAEQALRDTVARLKGRKS